MARRTAATRRRRGGVRSIPVSCWSIRRCTPVGAMQVEMSCSLSQRKVLTPNDCDDVEAVRLRLAVSEELAHQHPTPVQGKFDRTNLTVLFARLESRHRAFIDARFTCQRRQHNLIINYETEHSGAVWRHPGGAPSGPPGPADGNAVSPSAAPTGVHPQRAGETRPIGLSACADTLVQDAVARGERRSTRRTF